MTKQELITQLKYILSDSNAPENKFEFAKSMIVTYCCSNEGEVNYWFNKIYESYNASIPKVNDVIAKKVVKEVVKEEPKKFNLDFLKPK